MENKRLIQLEQQDRKQVMTH